MISMCRMFPCAMILIVGPILCEDLVEASASWPNEPSGSAQISDHRFDVINGDGWTCYCANVRSVQDPTAPLSPSAVGQWTFDQGMSGGISSGNYYKSVPNLKEVYFGYWWKPSNPWQGHSSNVNKISFIAGHTAGNFVMEMFGPPGGPYRLMSVLEFSTSNGHLPASFGDDPGSRGLFPNVGGGGISLGQWYRVEVYLKHSTTPTSRNGIVRWWLNGVLVGSHTSVNFSSGPWTEFQLNPTWGGTGQTKSQTDYYWYDHVHLSAPNSSSSSDVPAGPPAAPRIMNVTVQ